MYNRDPIARCSPLEFGDFLTGDLWIGLSICEERHVGEGTHKSARRQGLRITIAKLGHMESFIY
jgi:hypothetical protein